MTKTKYDPFGSTIKQEEKSDKKESIKRGYLNRTLTIREDHLEKLRAKAYWDRKTQREILEEALESYFNGKNIRSIQGG